MMDDNYQEICGRPGQPRFRLPNSQNTFIRHYSTKEELIFSNVIPAYQEEHNSWLTTQISCRLYSPMEGDERTE